ncbi:MAG: threonine--tRNA ligase [Burkholderiaceae bacterium]|nr:MAG: threonine--tRNA ligase [Burkholderiaceae bacterium]
MFEILLPDKSKLSFEAPTTPFEVARSISSGLAKSAVCARLNNDEFVDLDTSIRGNCSLQIITEKDPEGLEVIRHSTAHLLAYAAKSLFPDMQVTIGPVIEDGFYYDFAYSRPLTPEDLVKIENKMIALAKKNEKVIREVWSRDEAIDFFKSQGEYYKAKIIEDISESEDITLYREGTFVDLCRGPHVPSTGKLKAFKLLKVSGAYWRGDSKNEMLQRVYGTAWASKSELRDYLFRLEEAEKRDHRKIGKSLDLFHYRDFAPGMVFWHPNGVALWNIVEQYMRDIYRISGFQEVRCPMMLDKSLWEKSGHWEHYKEHMFLTASENREYAIKPMNCPGHVQVFNGKLRSYKDLPLRLGEFGSCHRNEPSGALHGLFRLRNFTQDDGHIFCTEDQIQEEVYLFTSQLKKVYLKFGFEKIIYKLSTRPKKRVGSDEIWDKSEEALKNALVQSKVDWEIIPGEGAFYGPKIEYSLKDSIGRVWQCGTIQIDFNMPKQLGAEYVSEDNRRETPVMLHRAILGSLERFIGILIENYGGAFPLWLAPNQVGIATISRDQNEYASKVKKELVSRGIRVVEDLRNEKITYKIREFSLMKLPVVLVVGRAEVEQSLVSVRRRGNKESNSMLLSKFLEDMTRELEQDT